VLTHGDEMRFLREKLPSKLLGPHFSTANELAQYLYPILEPDDVVLVKGSRRDSDFGSVCELLRDASKRVQNSNPAPSTLGEIRHLLDPDSGLSQNSDAVEFNAVSFSVETLNDRSVAIVQTEDGPMGLTQAQLRKHKASIVATIGVSPEQPLSDIPHIHDKKWSSTTKALAIMRRDAFKGTCFAVTGSAGKSSVNSMLLSTLRGLHTDKEILGTTGNQNMFYGGYAHTDCAQASA
jgi:UDP-N-acetylmuramyl pentapeptide synthase